MTEYIAKYTIFEANSESDKRVEQPRFQIDPEGFAKEWELKRTHEYRFNANYEEYAIIHARDHKRFLSTSATIIGATLDELLEVKLIDIKDTADSAK